MDRIVKTEEMIAGEETGMSHITIKNEPGPSVESGAHEVTVKPEHGHNIITSFGSLTRGSTIKTEHPFINQTEEMIAGEETGLSHITIKNEPGPSVESGAHEVTVKPEHGHNIITSFLSLTRGSTTKTEHPFINQTLVKEKDTMTVKYNCELDEQDDRLNMFSNTGNFENASSVRDSGSYTSTGWLMKNDANQDAMIRAESNQPKDVINIAPDHGMVNQERELMISDVRTIPILLPKRSTESSFVQANIGAKRFKCHVCGKSFTENGNLAKHSRIHTGEKPFKCEVCGKSFTQNGTLKEHCKIHTGEKPFKCQVCGKSFTQNCTLKEHCKIHTGEKPFKCQVCGKSFTRNDNLMGHSQIHMDKKPYTCNICGKSFTQNNGLTRHSRIHSGEKPFACQVCGKLFLQKCSLTMHSRIHTGERRFQCEVCGKSFTQNSDLTNHSRIHSGEKPFACKVCGKSFTQNSHLRRHSQIHTGDS